MPESPARVRNLPHYRITASELAKWIERQDESWWSVDGDPILTQQLDLPCPGDELATALRLSKNFLLLRDSREKPAASGETVSWEKVDDVAYIDDAGDRVFQLCWEDRPDVDWLLIEDLETSESSSRRGEEQ